VYFINFLTLVFYSLAGL